MTARLRSIYRNRRGGITVLLAGSLFMLAGAATVAVDLGSVFLARRELQGIADAAALAANSAGGRPAAEALIANSGRSGVSVADHTTGHYARDPAVAVENRYQAGDARGDATRLVLEQRVPLFFARLLMGRDSVDIAATATAARADMAAFSLGTGLASISDGVPNALLSALAGTELNLSVMDYQGLVSANADLLGFANALQVRLGRQGESHASIFGRDIPAATVVNALADSVASAQSATRLREIANRLTGRTIKLDEIIDLGPVGASDTVQPGQSLTMDAFTLLRLILTPPPGQSVSLDLNLNVLGLAGARLMLVTGGGMAHSPLLTITAARDVVIRTAQTRIYIESTVAAALSGIASIRVPVYIELASAEARLSDINCTAGAPGEGVTLAVTPSIGSAALADIDVARLTQFQSVMPTRPAILAQVLVTKIAGQAKIALGGTQPQSVHFSRADIEAQRVRTVATGDLMQGVASSLARDIQLQISVLGLTVSTGPLANGVGTVLGTAAPAIDGLLNQVSAILGLKLGKADVRVHQMRCGISTLVA